MKKYCHLVFLFLSIGCTENLLELNECSNQQGQEITISLEIKDSQEIQFSPILPETFFLRAKEGRKQFTVKEDSIIVNDYQE